MSTSAWLIATAMMLISLALPAGFVEAAVVRPFTTRFSANTTGAIVMTGNASLTCLTSATGCLAARTGTASTAGANNNNNFNMVFVDIDNDPTTFNSSRNTLTIPTNATVLYAGLYWGADTTAGTGGTAAAAPAARNTVLLDTPADGGYTTVTASQVDNSAVTGGFRYQGFADVTALVTAGRSGEYTLANLQAGRGQDRYGGWALVVAYQDPAEPVRNLTIFDGYAVVQQTPASDQNVAVPVSGFLTPPTGPVRSRVGVVAYEGDLGLTGDSLRLGTTPLTNGLNPATNFFNSSLSNRGSTNTTGDPYQSNLLGFDIDTLDVTSGLANGATSATINLNTTNDTYFPGVVTFSTELYAPRIEVEKSAVDLDGGTLDVGDTIRYTMRVANNGDDAADAVALTDIVPTGTSYVPGSLKINGTTVTDGSGDDTGEVSGGVVTARLGSGATATNGGRLAIGAAATVTFDVAIDTGLDADGAISNAANVTSVGATSGLQVDAISNTVVLSPRPRSDLSVLKFGPAQPVVVPGSYGYDIIVTNRGPSAEPAATLVDELPTGFVASSITTSQGTCTIGATIDCSLGQIPVGGTVVLRLEGSVAVGSGTITNTVTVAGANLDQRPGNDVAQSVVMLNNPPTAPDQATTTPSGTPVTVDVLSGATDPDGDPLTVTAAGPATNGSVIVNPDGTITYTPNPGFAGVDTFEVTIADGSGGTVTITVTVTVLNAPPVANDDAIATLPATPITVPVLANDTDLNGDSLTIVGISQPANGTAVVNPDGTITYTPTAGFAGVDTFTYTISDGTDTATATVTINVPNSAPVAVDDGVATPYNTAVTVPALANDLDDNGETLTVTEVSAAANGTVVVNPDGTVTYTPNASFSGVDTFTYTITDGTATSTATVTVTVGNAPPIANDDATTTQPGAAVTIPVLANDSDANGEPLTVVGTTPPGNGSVVLNADGTITYAPNPGFEGVDTFTYTITDGTDTATATVTITVPNSPPVAGADRTTTDTNTPVAIVVLANDNDPNPDDAISISDVTAPTNGSVVVNADGTITYTPNPGFEGLDTFTYTITDGTDTATATVTVRVLNAEPVAVDDSASTLVDQPVTIPVLANDSDLNGDALTVVAVSDPSGGMVTLSPTGEVVYTPPLGATGEFTFTYTITDGTATATATVTVTVSAPPPPTTTPPSTAPPSTAPPSTAPPSTAPPSTAPPTTAPPATSVPTSTAPPVGTTTPTTEPSGPTPTLTTPGRPARATPRGPLPYTGASIATTVGLAALALGGGAVALLASRRRRTAGH